MKIVKRLAEEQYCFSEISFDSLEEYRKEYPEFIKTYLEMKKTIKKLKDTLEIPFES